MININRESLRYGIDPEEVLDLNIHENCITEEYDKDLYELNDILTEFYNINSNSYLLLEDAMQAMSNYMQKFNNRLNLAWQRFNQSNNKSQQQVQKIMQAQQQGKYLNTGFRMRMPANYLIPNIAAWDRILSNKVVLLTSMNYNPMKQYLNTKEDYIQQYFRGIYVDKNKSLKQSMVNSVFTTTRGGEIIGGREIITPYSFLINYQNYVKLIQDDMNTVNMSTANVQKILGSLPKNEAVQLLKNTHIALNELGIKDAVNQNKPTAAGGNIYDNNDNVKYMGDQAKNKPKSDVTCVRNYFTANLQIISGKMSTCLRLRSQCIKLLNYYIKLQGKNGNKNNLPTSNPGVIINRTVSANK